MGPHRDEVRFLVSGPAGGPVRHPAGGMEEPDGRSGGRERWRGVREFGSGGQKRAAALSLRLVEAATIRKMRGREPLVLMDDVFAELDAARSERLLALIEREETGQVILTVPKEGDIRVRKDSLPRWTIEGGRIVA